MLSYSASFFSFMLFSLIMSPLSLFLQCVMCRAEVVTLQFNHERRDRRKREYVMIELNHDTIIDILGPISEENQKAFSLASRVEVSIYYNLLYNVLLTYF